MPTVADVLSVIDSLAPWRSAYTNDPVGLQVGDPDWSVRRAVVALDRSMDCVRYVQSVGANLLVTHHPLFFSPLKRLTPETPEGKLSLMLAASGVALVSAHTNWDAAAGGINDHLACLLGLKDVRPFGDSGPAEEAKFVFYVPLADADRVLDAVSHAGAGSIGNYERCAFIVEGRGTFTPLPGANPAIGTIGRQENVAEARVETIIQENRLPLAVQALRETHPYEEPAYEAYPILDRKPWPIGRIGSLPLPVSLASFASFCEERLEARIWGWGAPSAVVRRVAVVGGSGDDLWRSAQAHGADVLVTGEAKQHVALEATEAGMAILAAGHYATENPGALVLADSLRDRLPDIEWLTFEPAPGIAGRPF